MLNVHPMYRTKLWFTALVFELTINSKKENLIFFRGTPIGNISSSIS